MPWLQEWFIFLQELLPSVFWCRSKPLKNPQNINKSWNKKITCWIEAHYLNTHTVNIHMVSLNVGKFFTLLFYTLLFRLATLQLFFNPYFLNLQILLHKNINLKSKQQLYDLKEVKDLRGVVLKWGNKTTLFIAFFFC